MLRWLTLSLWVAAGFAQTPEDLFNKPPADVDQALRSRISEFYQDHVDGKFRQAEALVAEDTKDFFYNGNKPKYLSFEIKSITYADGYTRAKALVLCEQYVPFPGFEGKPFRIPATTTWKIENGQWVWYVDQEQLRNTPFGKMTGGPGVPSGKLAIPDPNEVLKAATQQVKVDKQGLTIKPGSAELVTVTNSAAGVMSISVAASLPGVQVTPDHVDIPAGEKAVLTVRAGSDATSGVLSLRVDPINQLIPIPVGIQ